MGGGGGGGGNWGEELKVDEEIIWSVTHTFLSLFWPTLKISRFGQYSPQSVRSSCEGKNM